MKNKILVFFNDVLKLWFVLEKMPGKFLSTRMVNRFEKNIREITVFRLTWSHGLEWNCFSFFCCFFICSIFFKSKVFFRLPMIILQPLPTLYQILLYQRMSQNLSLLFHLVYQIILNPDQSKYLFQKRLNSSKFVSLKMRIFCHTLLHLSTIVSHLSMPMKSPLHRPLSLKSPSLFSTSIRINLPEPKVRSDHSV